MNCFVQPVSDGPAVTSSGLKDVCHRQSNVLLDVDALLAAALSSLDADDTPNFEPDSHMRLLQMARVKLTAIQNELNPYI